MRRNNQVSRITAFPELNTVNDKTNWGELATFVGGLVVTGSLVGIFLYIVIVVT